MAVAGRGWLSVQKTLDKREVQSCKASDDADWRVVPMEQVSMRKFPAAFSSIDWSACCRRYIT